MAVFGLSGADNGILGSGGGTRVGSAAATLAALPEPFDKLRVSFGLAAGEVVVGMLGSRRRARLAVIGGPPRI